jgi:aminoglycoside 2'-N-acetyltransferase I
MALLMGDVDRPVVVSVRSTESLTAEERSAVIALCIAAHDNDDFEQLFTYVPTGGRHVLLHCGSELVSHALVTTRWLQQPGTRALKTAYVDAVSTHPAHHGRRHGTAVMTRLADSIDDHEIGCLQTDRAGFYERLGWVLWRGPLAGREGRGLVPTPQQTGVMVLTTPRTPPLDLDGLLTIERQPHRIWE